MNTLTSNTFLKQEDEFLTWVEIDYVALDELVYIATGCNKPLPTEKEYLEALNFLSYLMTKYKDRLKCIEGPKMEEMKNPAHEIITWLKEMWYADKYKEINYGIWFDLEFTKSELVFFAKELETLYKSGKIDALDRDQALPLAEQAKKLGVKIAIDKGYPNTFWNMEHLSIGPNGYHVPILPK